MDRFETTKDCITILDDLTLDHAYAINKVADDWVGEIYAIRWDEIRQTASSIAQLSADITRRPPSEFVLMPYLSGKDSLARVGIRVAYCGQTGLNEKEISERTAAVCRFLARVTSRTGDDNHELPLGDDAAPVDSGAIDSAVKNFIEEIHGKEKCAVPFIVSIGNDAEVIAISKFSARPVDVVAGKQTEVDAFVEGLDREDRSCRLKLLSGQTIRIKMHPESHLHMLKDVLCNDRPYRIVIDDVLDAKGRGGQIVSEISAFPLTDAIELSPSPPRNRRSRAR